MHKRFLYALIPPLLVSSLSVEPYIASCNKASVAQNIFFVKKSARRRQAGNRRGSQEASGDAGDGQTLDHRPLERAQGCQGGQGEVSSPLRRLFM